MRARTRNVVGEWAALLTDRAALGAGFDRHAPGLLSPGQLDDIHRWCVARDRLRTRDGRRRRRGSIRSRRRGRRAAAAHLPAAARAPPRRRQGRARLRAPDGRRGAGLLAAGAGGAAGGDVSQRCVTLAGDTAQAIAPEHGFSSWTELLDFLEHRARARRAVARQLPIDARNRRRRRTRARPADGRRAAGRAARGRAGRIVPVRVGGRMRGVPVARAQGAGAQRAGRLGRAARAPPRAGAPRLRGARRTPRCRRLRLVADQDFSFSAGIDVTDVRQSKGLEFDIVILLDVTDASYPANDDARRLLHVAMTRAAHQLWITYVGNRVAAASRWRCASSVSSPAPRRSRRAASGETA